MLHLGRASAEVPPKHVLVCAPSNAAIDEIVSRLLQHSGPGMLNEKGEFWRNVRLDGRVYYEDEDRDEFKANAFGYDCLRKREGTRIANG